MEKSGIEFLNGWEAIPEICRNGRVVHMLCTSGRLRLKSNNREHIVTSQTYSIFLYCTILTDLEASDDFHCIAFAMVREYINSVPIRNNYAIIGYLSLMHKPVMILTDYDYQKLLRDLGRLQERVNEHSHRFHDEMVKAFLGVHSLDLYDIHARQATLGDVSDRKSEIVSKFIFMLLNGDFKSHRDIKWYADALHVTPHYLTDLCRMIGGEPASFWIDYFLTLEIVTLLSDKSIPLSDIAFQLNFSSQSYFSRYVQKHLGLPPSALR